MLKRIKRSHLITGFSLVAVLFLGYRVFSGGNNINLASSLSLLCVETGEVIEIAREDVNSIPFKNPRTGRVTLYPYEVKDGQNVVAARFRPMIENPSGEAELAGKPPTVKSSKGGR